MKERVASFLFSALRRLYRRQPDLSLFTEQTEEREPNLSFHFCNELWPYLFWLQCDFDVTKGNLGDLRPDIIFHRRGIHSLNFLVIEVKRSGNRHGVASDVDKITDYWFGRELNYRFGASVLMDERRGGFSVHLLENIADSTPLNFTQDDVKFWRPIRRAPRAHRAAVRNVAGQIVTTEKARNDTTKLKSKLDRKICAVYEPTIV